MLIDSHCHLDYFVEAERAEVIARAKAAGVDRDGHHRRDAEPVPRSHWPLRKQPSDVWACVGIHPNHAADEGPVADAGDDRGAGRASRRSSASANPGWIISTTRRRRTSRQQNFRANIRAAQLSGLPLAIHARDADDDIARILAEERAGGGDFRFPAALLLLRPRSWPKRRVAMGGYVSFSGILTFPKSQELREIAADIPLDRLLVETDSPYLAPVPFRGKRNEPALYRRTPPKFWRRSKA